jgi:hypothetical protein
MREEDAARMTARSLEILLPRRPSLGLEEPLDHAFEQVIQELFLSSEVRVERHRRSPELVGERAHRQPTEAPSVHEAQGRVDHAVTG